MKGEKERLERISAEKERLIELFKDMPEKTMKKVLSLIDNVAFMTITLEDLQAVTNKKGCIEEYQNGANQKGFKKSSEIEVYNTMIKNHAGIMKQLTDLTPEAQKNNKDEPSNLVNIINRK